MKILLTGGGTSGHALPVILVGKTLLKNSRVKLLYVGSRQGIERNLSKDYRIPFKALIVGKRRAYFSLENIWDYFKIIIGLFQAYFIMIIFQPKVIFAKGGYVTVPIIFWAKIFKIPLVIHESDVVMGKANLWAMNSSRSICLGFPVECYKENLPLDKMIYTGIPVSPEFLQTSIKSGERKKLLITGGSQGSSKINNLISEILPDLLKKYEIWHLCGSRDYENLKRFANNDYHLFIYSDQMPQIMRDADLVITRAGANTLMEISATGKAAIIIPLLSAANEHQEANARVYFDRNAGVVLKEDKITSNSIASIINNLMDDDKERQLLGHHARSLYHQKSAEEIIDCIFQAAINND